MDSFKKNIRALREYLGLNYEQILENLNIKRTTWSNYENGVSNPNLEDFVKIAKFFGVTETDFLHNESLIEVYIPPEKLGKSKPKGEPKRKPNGQNVAIFEEPEAKYGVSEVAKNKDETIAALQEVIITQKALIQALTTQLNGK